MHRFDLIPNLFHCFETDEPFARCSDCKKPLHDKPNGYLVQKAFQHGEPIMEVALCYDCHQQLQADYSEESRDAIINFHLDHADLPNRLEQLHDQPTDSLTPWIGSCLTCQRSLGECDEYILATQCIQDVMVFGEVPVMVCGTCMQTLVSQLSEKTRDENDRWRQRCLPMAPAQPDDGPKVGLPF